MVTASDFAGRRVLITGGLGFIGSNLAIVLAKAGAQTTVIDALIPEHGGSLHNVAPVRDRIQIVRRDLRETAALPDWVRGQDVIFNLAGQVSHLRSMDDPAGDLEINCRSQLSLLEVCRQVNPTALIVLASTRQVYGRPLDLPVDESHPTVPADINGIHKLAAEMYHTLYHQVHRLKTVILRLTNTFGPRMDLRTPDKGVIGVFLRRALMGETLQIFGSGEQRRDINYVDDVVDALLRAASCEAAIGGIFNLGHPQPLTLIQFVQQLQRVTQCQFERVPFPPAQRAIDIGDYYGDFSRFQALTGWQPRVDVEQGIRATVAFVRENAAAYLDKA